EVPLLDRLSLDFRGDLGGLPAASRLTWVWWATCATGRTCRCSRRSRGWRRGTAWSPTSTSSAATTRSNSPCAACSWASGSRSERTMLNAATSASVRRTDARLVDEALGGGVDLARAAACGLVDVERSALHDGARRRRHGHLVVDLPLVIRVLEVGVVDAAELEEHLDEVRLPLRDEPGHVLGRAPYLAHAEMLAIQHLLGRDQLLIELV